MIAIELYTSYNLMILTFSETIRDMFDRICQGTEPLLSITWPDTAIHSMGYFLPACGFCAGQFMTLWTMFSIPHHNAIKTWNFAPARNCISCFPALFSVESQPDKAKSSISPKILGTRLYPSLVIWSNNSVQYRAVSLHCISGVRW